jgi:hypothetical protein
MGYREDMGSVCREQGRYGSCLCRTLGIWVLFIRNRGAIWSLFMGTVEIWALFMENSGDMGIVHREHRVEIGLFLGNRGSIL